MGPAGESFVRVLEKSAKIFKLIFRSGAAETLRGQRWTQRRMLATDINQIHTDEFNSELGHRWEKTEKYD
jgi:hypothetical protein